MSDHHNQDAQTPWSTEHYGFESAPARAVRRSRWHRTRSVAISVAAAVVLALGIGGVAIGHAVADGNTATGDRHGPRPTDRFDGGTSIVGPGSRTR
jgi:ferric-dicitrate binding protein FerR (iron transport regulator)